MIELKAAKGAIQSFETDLIVVNLFEGVKKPGGATGAVDGALGGLISKVLETGDFKGEKGKSLLIYSFGRIPAPRILIVGLGKKEDFNLDVVREVSAVAAQKARELGVRNFATIVHGGGAGGLNYYDAAFATAEGILLGSYRFKADKKEEDEQKDVEEAYIVEFDAGNIETLERAIENANGIAKGVYLTRDLVNLPPNVASPSYLAEVAERLAKEYKNVKVEIYDRKDMEKLGMGAFLAVAQGSASPPKFIVLEYRGKDSEKPIVIAGKGITFDTGGISLKPSKDMWKMKFDMAGAAAVLGTIKAAAELKLPLRIVGLIGATYNMPDGNAYRPGDVVKAMNGKTIEIISTDAEGRLVLADLLSYATLKLNPELIVDFATLTGACIVALGTEIGGLFTDFEDLEKPLLEASGYTGETLWKLPLYSDYKKLIKSDFADIKNSGGVWAGAITAALFLKEFVGDNKWAHIDIAGPAWRDEDAPYIPKGATGFGVRLMLKFLEKLTH